jgi:hypothetical protein
MWMQQPPPPPPAAQEVTPLSSVEVVAPRGTPKVVATYPAQGAAVAPGVLVLMVRFDNRMKPESWDYGPAAAQPPCLERPRLLKDQRTFVLMCSVGFNKSFTLQLNGAAKGFADIASTPAEPHTLSFTTTDGEPTADVTDALKLAGLTDIDSPILNSTPATDPKPAL